MMSSVLAMAMGLGGMGTYPPPAAPAPLEPPEPHGKDGTIYLSPTALLLSSLVLLINGLISLKLDLQMHAQLAVATVRMVVQLAILGFILKPIFAMNSPLLVLGYAVFMVVIASIEAVSRPNYTYKGLFVNTLLAMALGSGVMLTYTVLVVLCLQPWWEAQYVIPMLGMLLGNCTSGVSLGLSTVLEELTSKRDAIEWQLAMGANRWEATEAAIRSAVKTSMTPLLNQMSVMGLVAIPGMMTGQILAGGDPSNAARYQMLIMFVVGGSSALASVTSIYMATLHVVDAQHCFRREKLIKQGKKQGADPWLPIQQWFQRLGLLFRHACCCCCGSSVPSADPPGLRAPLLGAGDVESAAALAGGSTQPPQQQPGLGVPEPAPASSASGLPLSLRAVSAVSSTSTSKRG